MTSKSASIDSLAPGAGFYRDIIENCADAVIVLDSGQRIAFLNKAAESIFGHMRSAILGQPLDCLIPERFRTAHKTLVDDFSQSAENARFMQHRDRTIVGLHADGTEISVEVSILNTHEGSESALVAIVRDVSVQMTQEQELERLAATDPLTGILNRRMFIARAREECARSTRYGNPLAFAMIDIDKFKLLNDEFGHATGDKVLCNVVDIISAGIRQSDIFGRWGGEEFVLALPETAENDALVLLQRLRQAVAAAEFTPHDASQERRSVTVSIGVAGFRAGEESLDRVIDRADQALMTAKRTGRNKVCALQSDGDLGTEDCVA